MSDAPVSHTMSRDDYMRLLHERNAHTAEVERLRARVERLEGALRKIVTHSDTSGELRMVHFMRMLALVHEAARAALAETQEG